MNATVNFVIANITNYTLKIILGLSSSKAGLHAAMSYKVDERYNLPS